MNLRPLGYEPNELPGCSTPRQEFLIISDLERLDYFFGCAVGGRMPFIRRYDAAVE